MDIEKELLELKNEAKKVAKTPSKDDKMKPMKLFEIKDVKEVNPEDKE